LVALSQVGSGVYPLGVCTGLICIFFLILGDGTAKVSGISVFLFKGTIKDDCCSRLFNNSFFLVVKTVDIFFSKASLNPFKSLLTLPIISSRLLTKDSYSLFSSLTSSRN